MLLTNPKLEEFAHLVETGETRPFASPLKVGVDLGTANIVLAVVDQENNPIAGMSTASRAVKDGIVVDFLGAAEIVKNMKLNLEERLGTELTHAATAIPPGILEGNVRCIVNCVERAGFEVNKVIDEPTAAARLLGITDGAVVDIGGGTTGISILEKGKVIFVADEPTGGTHMTLTLAGYHQIDFEEAEALKLNPQKEEAVFPIVKPVVEKMATIVQRFIQGHKVEKVYLVGGACSFLEFTAVFSKILKIPVYKPKECLYVTPLGIAIED